MEKLQMNKKGKSKKQRPIKESPAANEEMEIESLNDELYSNLSIDDLDKLLDKSFTIGSCWAQTCPCKHLSPCECAGGREIYCDWYVSW